ncbi:MAG: O-antigen ligase family protein, partial [Solirubrobacterales bacterium]|nr:O-antigen ligase family protein [Solirubrobacterales bacterium]
LSLTWAPLAGSAYHAGQRTVLYAGALLAATMLLRDRSGVRAAEPALAAGALVVVGYGVSERLVPGLLHFQHSVTAEGRLEQPLTYWNAMGELAALGFVLSTRIAGDAARKPSLRILAAGGAVPLGLGLYLSFSRGALFACFAGLVALIVLAPNREQLRSIGLTVCAALLVVVSALPFAGVTSLSGSRSTREAQGAVVLVVLLLIVSGAAFLQRRWSLRAAPGALALPRRTPVIALGVICLTLTLAIVAGAKERSTRHLSVGTTRYATLQSNRYAYWRVAIRAFRAQPIRGVGAGGWAVWWLRYRTINEFAQDAHSLPLQTLAELGVVGLALLAAFLAGLAGAAKQAYLAAPALAAGPIAGITTYFVHSPLDWDWQMPALSLVALALAGAIIALAESPSAQSASAIRGASRRKTQTAIKQVAT